MKKYQIRFVAMLCPLIVLAFLLFQAAWADEGHRGKPSVKHENVIESHKTHSHKHDFQAMEAISGEEVERIMALMMDIGLALPPMDSNRGRETFLAKGCVVCHSVNNVGGTVGPSLNAEDMPEPMNAFEFAARMWRGAPAMVQMQQDLLGEAVDLNGQQLADIIAFVHDGAEQRKLQDNQIPEKYRGLVIR